MTQSRKLDRINSAAIVNVHVGAEATYTTILTIPTGVYGAGVQLGLRGRASYRNIGSNAGYGGYAETCAAWNEGWGSVIGNISGNGNALGHVGSVTGLTVPVVRFLQSGANILMQVSGLDTDNYDWFGSADIQVLETA